MAKALLKAQDLSLRRRERLLFEQLCFEIYPSQLWHLRGPNGSGKSSLLDVLVGLTSADSGEVLWYEAGAQASRNGVFAPALARRRACFHYCRQQTAVNLRLSVRENIERQALWANSRFSAAQLLAWAEEVELLALLDEPAAFLSQGQKKQIALARLRLFGQRALWLLDEPFNSLDQLAVERLEQWIAEHIATGGAVILVSHTEQCQTLPVHTLQLSGTV